MVQIIPAPFDPVRDLADVNESLEEIDSYLRGLGDEMVVNGGFENWDSPSVPSLWGRNISYGTIERDSVNKHSGSYSVKLTWRTGGQVYHPQLSKAYTVVPGAVYHITFWTRGNGTYSAKYAIYDGTHGTYLVSWTIVGNTSTNFVKFTYILIVPEGCTSITLFLITNGSVDGSSCNFDDVSFRRYIPLATDSYDNEESGLSAVTKQDAIDELAASIGVLESDAPTRVILPDEITAVVGDQLQVFTRGIIEAQDPYREPFSMICSIGNAYPRYFEVTPESGDVGTKEFRIKVYNKSGAVKTNEACNIIVVNPTGQPDANTNVLCLGDSLGSGWPPEFSRRLVGSGGSPAGMSYGNITFIGNAGSENAKYVANGGWTMARYIGASNVEVGFVVTCTHDKDLTDQHSIWVDANSNQWKLESIESEGIKFISYNHTSDMPAGSSSLAWVSGGTHTSTINYTAIEEESPTPFWDSVNNEFSITAFLEDNGYSTVDVVYILLGWNGLPLPNKYLASDHTVNIGHFRTFLDKLHSQYPNCLVRILGLQVPSTLGGQGANYGAAENWALYNMIRSLNGLQLAYQDLCNESAYSSWCRYISIAAQFDSENNMPSAATAVNSRNSTTELRGTNGVHPATSGYYQIEDAAFRDFIRTFCSS